MFNISAQHNVDKKDIWMTSMDKMNFSGPIVYTVVVFSIFGLTGANRCDYAKVPSRNETMWKDEGEDLTVNCPGYKNDASLIQTVEYYWYRQEYNCKEMNPSNRIAYYAYFQQGSPRKNITYPEKMAISETSGGLTIRNLAPSDEQTLTCLFTGLQDYVATVHLKIKEFEPPILTDMPENLQEDEVEYAKCELQKMHPAKGFIEVKNDDEIITTVLIDGSYSLVVPIPIQGKAKPDGNNVTCTAVQNVSGVVKRLSTSIHVNVLYSYHTKVVSSIPEQPMEFTNVTLTCDITREGNPKEISGCIWLKDGQEETYGQALQLRNVTEGDTGSYQCLITNRAGIKTPFNDGQKLQLDVVPLLCLPKPDFKSHDIKLRSEDLQTYWQIVYPCQRHKPDVELIIEVHAENETEKFDYQNIAWMSEKQMTIRGRFDISLNHEVCLVLKKFPGKKHCENTKIHSNIDIVPIVGYSILGASVLVAIIGSVCWAISSKCRKSKSRSNLIREDIIINVIDHYEDMDRYKRCTKHKQKVFDATRSSTLPGLSQSVNHYEEGDPPDVELHGLCSSSLPALPPPPPDVRILTGSRTLDFCPEDDQHYRNRTAIMATIPRKPRYSVARADSLGSLLDYCKDSYGLSPKKIKTTEEPSIPSEYVDMNNDAVCKAKQDVDARSDMPARISGSSSPLDGNTHLQLDDIIAVSKPEMQFCKDYDNISQNTSLICEVPGKSTEYMDMRGADALKKPEID